MDHTPRDRQIPGEPGPAAGTDQGDGPSGCLAGASGVRRLRWARCPDDGRLGTKGYPVAFPVPDPPLISAGAAARALQEYFLANVDRGDNAANDELVTEILRRIRTLRASRERGC